MKRHRREITDPVVRAKAFNEVIGDNVNLDTESFVKKLTCIVHVGERRPNFYRERTKPVYGEIVASMLHYIIYLTVHICTLSRS